MTKRILVCLVLAAALGHVAFALPDLVVSQLDVAPAAPTDGTLVAVTAFIENVGDQDTESPFFVQFTVDGQEVDVLPLSSLSRGRTKQLQITWRATAGLHTLAVGVDAPFGRVDEDDEDNNTRSLPVNVLLDAEIMARLAPLRIAVAQFDDLSLAGFVRVGEGVADALGDRLAAIGLRVLHRSEVDAAMQLNGLNPTHPADVAAAARLIGADLLVQGSVDAIDVTESSVGIAFFRVGTATATVTASAQLVDVSTSLPLAALSAQGQHEGTTGFSIDLGQLLISLDSGTSDVCLAGGLEADRAWYNTGQTVHLGHRNPGPSAWFGIEIHSSAGAFLAWLGWRFIATDDCGTWFWDQQDASGLALAPGIYTAKLWDGTSYIDTASFQIRPGVSLSVPATEEITVGSNAFSQTVVGTALTQAIDRLTSTLLLSLQDETLLSGRSSEEAPMAAAIMAAEPRVVEGQIAAVLPDGRIAINLGASTGVTLDDRFEVLEVENLILDPGTGKILSYDVLSARGELRIIEVREQVSFATALMEFAPAIGDVARRIP